MCDSFIQPNQNNSGLLINLLYRKQRLDTFSMHRYVTQKIEPTAWMKMVLVHRVSDLVDILHREGHLNGQIAPKNNSQNESYLRQSDHLNSHRMLV